MTFPDATFHPDVQARKAKLARRRSRLVWPDRDLSLQTYVRIQARIALRESVRENFSHYRICSAPETKAKIRSYVRAQITAIRILTVA